MKSHIMIVDDDARIRVLLAKFLNENNFLATATETAYNALKLLSIIKFDLLILDINMPQKSGLELTSEIRKFSSIPIIILTAKHEVHDRIFGLEIGADDYLSKPFEPKELLLRMSKILSRNAEYIFNKQVISFGDIVFNQQTNQLYKKNNHINLTDAENALFKLLIDNNCNILTRETISIFLRVNDRSVDVLMTRLRNKIEHDSKNPQYLRTIRGQGYGLFI